MPAAASQNGASLSSCNGSPAMAAGTSTPYIPGSVIRYSSSAVASSGSCSGTAPRPRIRRPGLDGHYLWNSVGNPLETSIAAAQLVAGGVLERCPSLIVLLAHGGGALLSLRGRLRHAHAVRPEARSGGAADPDEMLGRLYFDSLTHDRDVLADLVGFAGAGHVLLGTDGPFDMGTEQPLAEIAALNLPPAAERLILGGNACRLMRTRPSE